MAIKLTAKILSNILKSITPDLSNPIFKEDNKLFIKYDNIKFSIKIDRVKVEFFFKGELLYILEETYNSGNEIYINGIEGKIELSLKTYDED
jgi:hypothetical protein